MIAQHPAEELLLVLSDEPPCQRCGDWHELRPDVAAACRRAEIVRLAAIDTCRQISERQRAKALQRARAMP